MFEFVLVSTYHGKEFAFAFYKYFALALSQQQMWEYNIGIPCWVMRAT
jgi:hypothetical protein